MASDDEGVEYYEEEDYDEAMDDDCYEEPMPSVAEAPYTVLSQAALEARQQQEIARIREVLDVDAACAAVLLRAFHWNVEALMNRCFEAGRAEVFRVAGAPDGADASPPPPTPTASLQCLCCLDTVRAPDTTALHCGHRFCNDCWQGHIKVRINDGEARRIRCMQRHCHAILSDAIVSRFVAGPLLLKYRRQLLDAYVEDNPSLKWCPSAPHCGNAVAAPGATARVIVSARCSCGHEFCFNCTQESHGPATCGMVKVWLAKLQADGGNTTWLSQNTKDCPVCGQPVEKNGGCNLMVCRCGAYFCWICGMRTGTEHTWTEIKGHTCGKYRENFDTDTAKTQLQRYQHYHDRFKANADSARLELRLVESLDARIVQLQRVGDGSLSSWDWLAGGIDTLRQCRQVLRWAYTWAYYAFGSTGPGNPFALRLPPQARLSTKNIFEDSQEQLEYLTERLSKELEAPQINTVADLTQLRSTVLRMSRAAANRCRGIFDVLEKNVPREEHVEFR